MIRVLREAGFEIEALHELRPAADATTRYEWVSLEWARQWPCEEIWVARKRRPNSSIARLRGRRLASTMVP